jgi:mRNA interferase MazF
VWTGPVRVTGSGAGSEVPLSPDDGMPADCVLNFDNLILLRKGWLVEPICQLSPVRMLEACRALSVAMGC